MFKQPAMVPRAPPITPPAMAGFGPCLSLYNAPVIKPPALYLEESVS